MTLLPPSPFLSDSEIPGALVAPGPAAVPFASPPVTAAGDVSDTLLASSSAVEQDAVNVRVAGSIPALPAIPSNEGRSREALPAVATEPHETGGALVFVLDEAAFMEAIEAA
jgi:hypothetical protein